MEKFSQNLKIPKYFGDFGGDYSLMDAMLDMKQLDAEHFESLLKTEEFAAKFDEILGIICTAPLEIVEINLSEGRKILKAPALSRQYILAGYLTIAILDKMDKAVMGTSSKDMALTFAKSCIQLNLSCKICLSKELSQDEELISSLSKLNVSLDVKSCKEMFDMPHCYVNFDGAAGYCVTPAEANYGAFPQVGLATLFAGLYSKDLKSALKDAAPKTIAIAITTGTEAVGAFPQFMNNEYTLATIEETVAKEYHIEDSGSYTLSTRSGVRDEANTVICPQLAYWWRMTKVYRLGCDKVLPVDTSSFKNSHLSDKATRAAAIAFDTFNTREILLLEEI